MGIYKMMSIFASFRNQVDSVDNSDLPHFNNKGYVDYYDCHVSGVISLSTIENHNFFRQTSGASSVDNCITALSFHTP